MSGEQFVVNSRVAVDILIMTVIAFLLFQFLQCPQRPFVNVVASRSCKKKDTVMDS